jgi:hypothetical protein
MALSKADILGASDLPTASVNVPQWGGDVQIRTLNGVEREELEKRIQRFKQTSGVSAKSAVRAVAVVMSAVDDNGQPLFSDVDTEALALKSGAALDLIFDEILEHNGMTKRAAEDLAKN